MTGSERPPTEVLAGAHGELRWRVVASQAERVTVGGNEAGLRTMLEVRRGDRWVAKSGFRGPPLYPGELVNEWRGRSDGLPYFVMARTDPRVDRLVAVTDRGTEVELAMSAVIPAFGLRFAAAALPEGEGPGVLRAESGGRVLASRRTPMWQPPAAPSGSAGWTPA